MVWHKEFTWGTHAIGNKNTIVKTNSLSRSSFLLSRRLQNHWVALSSKVEVSGQMLAQRLSVRSLDKAAPDGTGSRS